MPAHDVRAANLWVASDGATFTESAEWSRGLSWSDGRLYNWRNRPRTMKLRYSDDLGDTFADWPTLLDSSSDWTATAANADDDLVALAGYFYDTPGRPSVGRIELSSADGSHRIWDVSDRTYAEAGGIGLTDDRVLVAFRVPGGTVANVTE